MLLAAEESHGQRGPEQRLRILFLCTGNSCRSQMAEAWARRLKSDCIEAFSAGTKPRGVDARAIRVMADAGVDMAFQTSKSLDSLLHVPFDHVVTVCDSAREACPVFPGNSRMIHVRFDDPPELAKAASSEEEALSHYRRVRDEIRAFIETLPEALAHLPAAATPPERRTS